MTKEKITCFSYKFAKCLNFLPGKFEGRNKRIMLSKLGYPSFAILAKRCNCIAMSGYCHDMLSVVSLTECIVTRS